MIIIYPQEMLPALLISCIYVISGDPGMIWITGHPASAIRNPDFPYYQSIILFRIEQIIP